MGTFPEVRMDWPKLGGIARAYLPGSLLLVILVVALGLRLYGIGWDAGHGFHPDERSLYMRSDCMYRVLSEVDGYANGDCIRDNPEMEPGLPGLGTALDANKSPLNPHWFPLGSILIYLMVLIRFLVEPFTDMGSLERMSYAGRTMMALADVGSVFMVYLLGKRIYSRRVGLLASGLVALAVVHIQISHFYRPEPLLVFFLLASFWFMLQVVERRRLRDSMILGTFVGLTLAAKVSVLPLVLPLILVYAFRLFTAPDGEWTPPSLKQAVGLRAHAILVAVAAVAVFFVTTPYAFLDITNFVGDIVYQANNVAKTAGKVPFTVQYIGTTPFLYELQQISLWGLGLPLAIVAWGGLLFTVGLTLFRLSNGAVAPRGELLLLAWVVPNLLLLGVFETKFVRYIFPTVPFLVLMGSGMLFWVLDRVKTNSPMPLPITIADRARARIVRHGPQAVIGVMVVVVVATAFYALAFERVYARDHPAVQASNWINANVPKNSNIVTDNHWDEGIPDIYDYKVRQIPIYDVETSRKMDSIAGDLAQGQYLVFYSNRTYGSVARLPERYPLSSRYYQLLFSEKLGYKLERAFTSYPQLLGLAFVDDTFTRAGVPEPELLRNADPAPLSLNLGYADENFIGYDHPKVLLFRNVDGLSQAQLSDLLNGPQEPPPLGLMMSPELKAIQRAGGTWSEIINRDSWANAVPVLAWLLLVELIYLISLPLATFLFRPLPDRGIVLARILGLLGVAYVAWLLASVGWMGFSRGSVLVGIVAMAFLSVLVLATRWREFQNFVVRNWRLIVIGEILFLVAFLSFVAIRWASPDLWHPFRGGEKPMDFAYLNAVLRSTHMPPYDPWFSGGYLNYYYWGQFIVATLIKGTGIVPSIAYNLAVPLIFALTVTGAYSLVYHIPAGVRRPGHRGPDCAPDPPVSCGGFRGGMMWDPVVAGILGALFVAVIGNLDHIWQILRGGWGSVVHGDGFPALSHIADFWRSSRMLPLLEDVNPSGLTFWLPDKLHPDIGHHITEFPFFSFLFADLHAHMIAVPFSLLVLGLAFSLLLGMRAGKIQWFLVTVPALSVALGALWAINSWDYPAYVVLVVLLIGVGAYLRPGKPLSRLWAFAALALAVVLLSILAFLPFHANYDPYPTGIDVAKWQTPLPNYIGIHGLFLFVIVTLLLYVFGDRLMGLKTGRLSPCRTWLDIQGWMKVVCWEMVVCGLGGLVAIYMAIAGYWTAAVLTLLLGVTLCVIKGVLGERRDEAPYILLPLIFILMALLIGVGVEFVRAEGDIGRMNTLFKYYLEAWVLFAMASAYGLWYLRARGLLRIRRSLLVRGPWVVTLVLLLASSLIYPVMGTRSRLADRFSTHDMSLDGADFMKTAVYAERDYQSSPIELRWDYEAMVWLQDNVKGSPVVLEAHHDQYRWSSRIADYTGLPTVIGWPWHQIQQRMKYNGAVRERASHVREIYTTTDIKRALELLRQYEVEYVVIGQLETVYYPLEGLKKFDEMVQAGWTRVVYSNEGTLIYRAQWYN